MKTKKLIALCTATLALASAFSFSSCDILAGLGNNSGNSAEKPNPGKNATYVMEAEYIDLDNVSGSGISDSKSGVAVIFGDGTDAQKALGWGEGYYVTSSYSTAFSLTFKVTADKAATATLVLRVGSEIGNISMSSKDFSVKVNGTEVNYSNMSIMGSDGLDKMTFYDKPVGTINLVKGENTITLSTNENTLRNGQLGGPMIDSIKLTTTAGVTFTEKKDNPSKRGEI